MLMNEGKGHQRNVHGKPYEGKLPVRIDEGSPETGRYLTTALVTYSTSFPLINRAFLNQQVIQFINGATGPAIIAGP